MPRPEDEAAPVAPLIHPERLDPFFAALAELELGRRDGSVRVLHYGDSTIGLDGIPGAARRLMQARFGDGGAGFVLMNRYSKSYANHAVRFATSGDWSHCYIAYGCRADGDYGLGGVVFTATSEATTKVSTLADGGLGDTMSRAELWYQAFPGGGRISIAVDGKVVRELSARAEQPEDRWEVVEMDEGAHSVTVRALGSGKVRAYGLAVETGDPGVVWDSITLIGAYTRRLRLWNREQLARQLTHRDPDLLVMTFGGNDLRRIVTHTVEESEYVAEYLEVLALMRAGKPELPCLVMSVIDHGRSGKQTVETRHVETMVAAQASVAAASGCAFFDTYAAMGGAGSMRTLREATPPLASPDLKHLNARGQKMVGTRLFESLIAGYVAYRRERRGRKGPAAGERGTP